MTRFLENVESEEPGSHAVTMDTSKAIMTWDVENPSAQDLRNNVIKIMGSHQVSGTAKINRQLPLAHPYLYGLYAQGISPIKGKGQIYGDINDIGNYIPFTSVPGADGVEPFPEYILYPYYRYAVEFGPRPFRMMLNDNIVNVNGSWYPEKGFISGIRGDVDQTWDGQTLMNFTYAKEWLRFTDYDQIPKYETVSAKAGGSLRFISSNIAIDGTNITDFAYMVLPDQVYDLTWYYVPIEYVQTTKCYFDRFIGRVNQNAWDRFGPGELLLLGYHAKKFSPPNMTLAFIDGIVGLTKLCHITFRFLYTRRIANDLAAVPNTYYFKHENTGIPRDKNYIMAGHNLRPNFKSRSFHYCESIGSYNGSEFTVAPRPFALSFPLEVLFSNPLAPGRIRVENDDD